MLTERELEVLNCMTSCNNIDQIADKLNITAHTVKAHRISIYNKFGVNSASCAVAQGFIRGYLGGVEC